MKTVVWLLVMACMGLAAIALLASAAFGKWNQADPPTPTPAQSQARVQCVYAGEVIFDQLFDRAEVEIDGLRVWIGEQSAIIAGDCFITPMGGKELVR